MIYKKAKERKAELLEAALKVARSKGFENMTRDAIAEEAGVSFGLVGRYLGTMNRLRQTVMRAAIRKEILEIIAYGLYAKDKQALKAPDELKARAFEYMGDMRV